MKWTRPALLALVLLAAGWPIAVPSVFAAFSAPCSAPGAQGKLISQTYVARGQFLGHTGTDITGALSDSAVRNIQPCSSPTSSKWDVAAVLPANLQSSADPSGHDIVQIGWMRCIFPSSSPCNDVPADGNMHFVYICDDVSGGEPCLADGWMGATPVNGRRYRFRVQYNQSGTGQWDYSIKDYTTGVTKTKKVTSHWHNGDGAWWGAETHDTGSTMGSEHVTNNSLNNYWIEYYRTSVGAWTIVTDISAADNDIIEDAFWSDPPNNPGTQPAWYSYGIYSQNYTNDAVNVYTLDH
jgi:hypothetical protein